MLIDFLLPLLISFAVSALLGIIVLPFLKKLKASQTERSDGPASHLPKTGTPTMGGVIFLIPWIIISCCYIPKHEVIISTVGFALVGFIDDFIKVVLKRSLGLRAWQKMALQLAVSAAVIFYIWSQTNISFDMRVPFSSLFTSGATAVMISLGWFSIPAELIVLCGTVNGSNFTDGLDGLAALVTVIIAGFISAAAIKTDTAILPAAAAMMGALLGFLLYNRHPAKVFMGDTGSLALGGFVAASAIMMNMPIYILIVAFVYFAEVCSVIIQVLYFKATGGKRFFRMAPIHHHFELGGWSEVKVVLMFSALTLILCIIGFAAI